jgi:hypothetical protein
MVTRPVEENLRLVFQAPKRPGMDDPVTVALVMGPPIRRRFLIFTTSAGTAKLRVGRKDLPFDLFQFLTGPRHG